MQYKNIQLLEGVSLENVGGIMTLWLAGNIYLERLYEFVGRYDYVATYTLKSDSPSNAKFGNSFTGLLVYTPNERVKMEQSYQSGSKTYGRVRINETNYALSDENIQSLKEEGVEIADIESVCALPMPRENLYVKDSVRKPHRLEIPLPTDITYRDAVGMIQHIYEECVKNNRELCPHEWNDYFAVKLLYYPDAMTEEEKQMSHEANGHIKEGVVLAMIRIKKEIEGELTEKEEATLKTLERHEWKKKLSIFETALSGSGTSLKQMKQKHPQQLAMLFAELMTFRPMRLNTLAHKYAIYLDLGGYLHILLRHVNETSVTYQPIAEKTKLMWNFEDLKYAIKGVVGVIADDYDEKRDNQAGRMYWTGDKAIEFGGDYYTLQIAPNGRIDTWYRMKNNVLGK